MSDIISDLTNKFRREMTENCDEMAFTMLNSYRITKDNWRDHIYRIVIFDDHNHMHYFVDHMYSFTIHCEMIFPDIGSILDDNYTARIIYKASIEERMIGLMA